MVITEMNEDYNKSNEEVDLICICCPKGCHLKVNISENKISGNSCERGGEYGLSELTNPKRTITTTVKVNFGDLHVVPVKTEKPIPKKLNFKCIEELNNITVNAPINIGDIIYENILETGVNIVACRKIKLK